MTSIFHESAGSGEPILFIHGLGGTGNVFGPQVQVLSRFFTCHRFDLPGAGLSPSAGENTVEALVDAALTVMQRVRVDTPVHVVAHSMGTVLAQHLALRHPERVRSLALLGPIHAPAEAARTALRGRAAKVRAEGMVSIADAIVAGGTSDETRAAQPAVAALIREIVMRQDAEGYANHCEALAGAQAADVAALPCPALLVTGDQDNTSPAPACHALANRFRNADLRVLDRTGHWLTLEHPSALNPLLTQFLLGQVG